MNNMIYENDIIGIKVVGYRYGKAPKCGRSYNYRENHYEDGVSMAQVCYYKPVGSFAANGEKKYYYEGVVSGIGSDNEIYLFLISAMLCRRVTLRKKLPICPALSVAKCWGRLRSIITWAKI